MLGRWRYVNKRRCLVRLADVLGWQVLHGYGMLGREDGLYGAVSFAYQG